MDDNKPSSTKRPRVYHYMDFRAFLVDSYAYLKSKNAYYSYRSFAKQASLASPNYFQLIVQGKRRIGEKAIDGFITALGLKTGEDAYFRALVNFNQAEAMEEKNKYRHELQQLLPHSQKKMISDKAERYLGNWLYPTLREAALLKNFSPDPHWLANRLPVDIPSEDIRTAFAYLLAEAFLVKTEQGYKAKDPILFTSDDAIDRSVQRYHQQILDLAGQILSRVPTEEREFRAMTLRVPEEALPAFKKKIREFRDEIINLTGDLLKASDATCVVQVNVQMFPLVKPK